MNLIQRYFLLVARHPIWFVLRVVACIYIFVLCGMQIYLKYNPAGVNLSVFYLSAVSFVIFVAVAYINEKVVRAKVTIAKLELNEMGVMLYPNNKVEIYEKPVWGKFPIHIVTFPKNWDWRTKKGDKKEVEIGIKIKISKTVLALVPTIIKFTFSGPFQPEDLRQQLQINFSPGLIKSSTNITRIISNQFRAFNNGASHDLIKGDLIDYLASTLSMQELTYAITRRISFPKNLFANVEKTEIEVLNPKFRFSKKA